MKTPSSIINIASHFILQEKSMSKLLTFLCILTITKTHTSGFDGNTLITTSSGRLVPIRELNIGDKVMCYNKNLHPEAQPIIGIRSITVNTSIDILTEENITLSTAKNERFFIPKETAWICAKNLKKGDYLLNENLDHIAILEVNENNAKKEMFIITVKQHHNFLASSGGYIAHNGLTGATVGFWAGKLLVNLAGYGAIAVVTVASGPFATAVGPALVATFAGPIELTSHAGAIAGGILGGIATGPA